jgi:hypothetical protein
VTAPPPPAIELTVSGNRKGNRVSVDWNGAGGVKTDIYRDGMRIVSTRNDGNWTDSNVSKGNSYRYRVCEQNSASACSDEVTASL